MEKTDTQKVVVLLSGGIDSTTCLAMAVDKYGAENVKTLNMFYGQKHEKEIESAMKVADFYGVEYNEIDLSDIFAFSDCPLLKRSSKEIKHQSYADQLEELGGQGTVDTYVPFRNGLFLATATSYALSIGANVVCYGAHADDAAGNAYPDCSIPFSVAMHKAIKEGTGGKVRLAAPLVKKNKAEVVAIGLELKAPYELTWSCYEGKEKPCGVCGTCIDRAKAFEANGVKDPALEVGA